jgi:hypothetical protein
MPTQSNKTNKDAVGKYPMERRLIRLDNLPDPAGITAALRRAFAERPEPEPMEDDDKFAELLSRLH